MKRIRLYVMLIMLAYMTAASCFFACCLMIMVVHARTPFVFVTAIATLTASQLLAIYLLLLVRRTL